MVFLKTNKFKFYSMVLLSIICTCFIFYMSLQEGQDSAEMSSMVVEVVREPVHKYTGIYLSDFMVRKAAHLTEFFVLGVITACTCLQRWRKVLWPFSFGYCALIAAIDETIQVFVSDRAGMFSDVLIDCTGAGAGVLMVYMFFKIMEKRHEV